MNYKDVFLVACVSVPLLGFSTVKYDTLPQNRTISIEDNNSTKKYDKAEYERNHKNLSNIELKERDLYTNEEYNKSSLYGDTIYNESQMYKD